MPVEDFQGRLHACADRIRTGGIGSLADLQEVWQLSQQLDDYGHSGDSPFVGPEGEPLSTSDAELVWSKSDMNAWTVTDQQGARLAHAHQVFQGKHDELDLPLEMLDPQGFEGTMSLAARIREWLGATLELTNPYSFSLDELATMAKNRLTVSQSVTEILQAAAGGPAIVEASAAEESVATSPVSQAVIPVDEPEVIPAERPRPTVPKTRPTREVPLAPPARPVPSPRREMSDFHPPRRYSGTVRPHRRTPEWPRRVKRATAMAAVAILAALTPNVVSHFRAPETTPAVQPAPPTAVDRLAVGGNGLHQHASEDEILQDTTEHLATVGTYNPSVRSGAVWFMVEDYAASLGLPKLTLAQSYELVDRTLGYMHMTWAQARGISPGEQLKFPAPATMRSWVATITGQNQRLV